jgi:hypothetical protein
MDTDGLLQEIGRLHVQYRVAEMHLQKAQKMLKDQTDEITKLKDVISKLQGGEK